MSPAGTTRACRPLPGCAGAASRPRRSANSSAGSASRARTASSMSRSLRARGTFHWGCAARALPAEVRLYHPLFTRPVPGADGDLMADLNPDSLEVLSDARVEPGLAGSNSDAPVQFERQGYFVRDADSSPSR